MYQPKIKDELIQRLYHLAKAQGIPMTRLVNQPLTESIAALEQSAEHIGEKSDDYEHKGQGRAK